MRISAPTRPLPRILAVLLPLMAALGFLNRAVRAGSEAAGADEARLAYSQKVSETYVFRWGKDSPFLPSLATSDNGEFMQVSAFPTSDYCGHCHEAAFHQWQQSAHSKANLAPWYKTNVHTLDAEKGIEFSRHCEGCHNPIALLSGALTTGVPESHSFDAEAVTCSVCHSIQSVDTRGTGSYVMGIPAVLVDETGAPIRRPVSDAEILAHLDRHSAAVMKPFYRSSEYCAVCHKAALPRQLNDYKWQRAISLYDEWQNSSFAKQSPLPFYVKPSISTCQTCHMQRETFDGRDPGAKKGMLASHRWLGANSLIPAYYGYAEQAQKIRAFLKNDALNMDLFALEKNNPHPSTKTPTNLIAPLGTTPFTLAPGDKLTVSLVIQNKGIAHSLVPEQRDMYEAWVDFQMKDAAGKVLEESGALRSSDNELDPSAHSFTNRLINKQGELNALHQVWNNRVLAFNNTIQSGRSQLVRYSFTVPAKDKGSLTLTATVRYRRFDQHFIDFAVRQKRYQQPIIDMATVSRTLLIGQNPPTPPLPNTNPEWMRWNNYGIALLDAQQYAASVHAFEHVAAMRPDYADAHTNIAIAMIAWERYEDARPELQRALTMSPDNARALYYLALVEREEGHPDQAIADLQQVAQQFPRSRDAHRELGFSYYQQHKYDQARVEYEAVQGIDPDDLAAHYNLAILYSRMGLKDKARQQAAFFADQKDDPMASTYALDYLRRHHEVAQESVPWHVHDLDTNSVDDVGAITSAVVPAQSQ